MVQAGSIQHLSLSGSPRTELGTSEPRAVPRQLPLAIRDFTGRAEHLAALDALLPTDDEYAGPGPVVVSALDGAAGIGKTTLAIWWAHRVQDQFPDGTLHANLRGYGPGTPASPSEVLEGFLRALGVMAERIPVGFEAQAGLFRSVLAGRRVLLVLDNANSADQVRPLLPGTPGCVVLVTSRESLTGLVVTDAATRLTVDLLSEDEAVDLVTGILGPTSVAAEPKAIWELVQYCGRLPLALRIAASHANNPNITVAAVVSELVDERYRLDVLSRDRDERAAVRAVFDWSYQHLSVEHARVFRRLGLHPGPEFSVQTAAAMAELDLPEMRQVLAALTQAHMIEPAARRDRYRFHDLLRAYAADRVGRDDGPVERERTRRLLLEWYAHHAKIAHQILFPAHNDWNPALQLTTYTHPVIPLTGRKDAWSWAELERSNLIASVRDAHLHGQAHLTELLATATGMILFRLGYSKDLSNLHQSAITASRHRGDRLAEIHALLELGEAYMEAARWQDAESTFEVALDLSGALGYPWRQATALTQIGLVHLEQRNFAQAWSYLQSALPLAHGAQHGRMVAVIEGNLSLMCIALEDYPKALRHARRSILLFQGAHDREGEAITLHQMARAHHGLGDPQAAVLLCEQALDIDDHYRYRRTTAEILDTLGTLMYEAGDAARTLRCWCESLRIYEDFDDSRAAGLRDRLRILKATSENNSC